ncbi:DUF6438 domain-containing protein [Chloroflexota bacterium]
MFGNIICNLKQGDILKKKHSLIVIILVSVLVIAVGCAQPQTPTPSDLDEVVITLERTPCFGACPEYQLTVYGNVTLVYEGKRFVRIEGKRTAIISEEKVRQLLSEFKEIDYFSLNDSYEEFMATDMPSAFTSLTIDGKTKTVRHYHGDFSAPKELTELEKKIDEIVNSNQWIKSTLE